MNNSQSRPNDGRSNRHDLVRQANIQQVYGVIAAEGPVSRVAIGACTGLSRPTVLGIVDGLASDGLIRSSVAMTGALGRAPVLYETDPTAGYALGVDLGGSKVHVAVSDLDGVILAEAEEPTTRDGSMALVEQLERLLRGVVRICDARWNKVLAVTVGSPGVVSADGTVNLASNIPGLETLAIGPLLQQRLRKPVAVENDVNVAALGELSSGAAQECQTFVVLSIGTGIGMGIVINGRLFRGAHGNAGEVSFLPIGADLRSAEARSRGALEVAAAGSAVCDLLRVALANVSHRSSLTAESTAREVYAAAAEGDELAVTVVQQHAAVLAEAVLAVASVIDPEIVVLAGGIGSNPLLTEPLRCALDQIAPFVIRVETTTLGPRAGIIGSIFHARHDARQRFGERHQVHRPWRPTAAAGDDDETRTEPRAPQ